MDCNTKNEYSHFLWIEIKFNFQKLFKFFGNQLYWMLRKIWKVRQWELSFCWTDYNNLSSLLSCHSLLCFKLHFNIFIRCYLPINYFSFMLYAQYSISKQWFQKLYFLKLFSVCSNKNLIFFEQPDSIPTITILC